MVPSAKCSACGFESTPGADAWGRVEHPTLGSLTQCPECGSTNVHQHD